MTIKDAIKAMAGNDGDELYSLVGVVTEIDEQSMTCTVDPVNGSATIYDVRFKCEMSEGVGFELLPKLNSKVVVTFLSANSAYVALYSEVTRFKVEIGSTVFEIEAGGLKLNNDQVAFNDSLNDLFATISNLIKVLKSFKVITPSGPSTAVSPDSLSALLLRDQELEQVKTKFKSLLP